MTRRSQNYSPPAGFTSPNSRMRRETFTTIQESESSSFVATGEAAADPGGRGYAAMFRNWIVRSGRRNNVSPTTGSS